MKPTNPVNQINQINPLQFGPVQSDTIDRSFDQNPHLNLSLNSRPIYILYYIINIYICMNLNPSLHLSIYLSLSKSLYILLCCSDQHLISKTLWCRSWWISMVVPIVLIWRFPLGATPSYPPCCLIQKRWTIYPPVN